MQCNLSSNRKAGTLRGMHFQQPPLSEAKLVRCVRGAIHDVVVDLRPQSATYLRQFSVELNTVNRRALFVPALFAHGFQTLMDDTEVEYQMSEVYAPETSRGFRYDDPAFRHSLAITGFANFRTRSQVAAIFLMQSSEFDMHALIARLYPICRSITGNGVRRDVTYPERIYSVRGPRGGNRNNGLRLDDPERVEHSRGLD